jgi:S-adenosylmethionine hydrolase
MPFVKSYGFVERGKILLTIGGSGFLEISKNWGDASEELRIRVGSAISLSL